MRHNTLSIAIVGIAALISMPNAWGGTALLSWDANTGLDLGGYKVYYGQSGAYSQSLDVGNVTSYTVGGLVEGRTYYFAVTAYNTLRNESGYSNEVSTIIPDTTPPLVSAIAAGNVSPSGATLSWFTNEPATSQVSFGPTTAYGASSSLDAVLVTSHHVSLVGLTPATGYHYRVSSRDAAGNLATSADAIFLTPLALDTSAPVISAVAAGRITTAGATITWITNEPSDSQVNYGPTAAYGSSTPLNITPVTTHSVTLSGLTEALAYHFRVKSRDQAGNVAMRGDFTFTPDGTPPSAPLNLLATPVSGSQITLAWSASPRDNVGVTGYTIERCQGSGCSGLAVIASVTTTSYSNTGLTLGATYSYQVRAVDAAGNRSAPSNMATVSSSANLVGNPSFEVDTSGWAAYGGAMIARMAGGYDGAYALEMRGPATTAVFGINDSPNNWVATTSGVGVRYRFTAWVRSASNTGRAKLQVREFLNGVKQGVTTTSASAGLTPGWQSVTVDYVSQAAGSTLDVQILDTPVVAGEAFQTDNISVRVVP